MQTEIEKVLSDYAARRLFTQGAVGILDLATDRRLQVFHHCSDGDAFDLASLTKLLMTAPLSAAALEGGQALDLDAPLGTLQALIPAISLPDRLSSQSLRSLLDHSSGLPAWHNFWIIDSSWADSARDRAKPASIIEEGMRRVFTHRRFLEKPAYSDIGYILLGYLLEAVNGPLETGFMTLKTALQSYQAGRSGFAVGPAGAFSPGTCFAESGFCHLRSRCLAGEVHDENAAALGGLAGHAGLFGTLPGVLGYSVALLDSAVGRRMLRESRQAVAAGAGYGMGFHLMNSSFSQEFAAGQALGHLGFTGCGLWFDDRRGRLVVMLCNRTVHSRLNPLIKEFRRDVLRIADHDRW